MLSFSSAEKPNHGPSDGKRDMNRRSNVPEPWGANASRPKANRNSLYWSISLLTCHWEFVAACALK